MELTTLLKSGGITLIVLVACSILSFAIIIERTIYFWLKSRVKRADFMPRLNTEIQNGRIKQALEMCKNTKTPFSQVAYSGLKLHGREETIIANAMERTIAIEIDKLERYTNITGTIAGSAVYIGLFGTVLGVMRAFRDIAETGSGGINVVIHGTAQALVTTAAGLIVAIPAVIFYNYFVKRINNFIMDMELCASETKDLLINK